MGGGKESPRQKMVGLMYLVLMALLAMNVSKSVLKAFVLIDNGLESTNHHFEENNARTYIAFDKARANDEVKVGPFWDKAQEVKHETEELVEYIHKLKMVNILFVEGWVPEFDFTSAEPDWDAVIAAGYPDSLLNLHHVEQLDNYDLPTNLMIGGEPTTPKEGPWSSMELKGKLQKFKEDMSAKFSEHPEKSKIILKGIEEAIKFEGQMHGDLFEEWEVAQFNHLPLAAVITNLSKMQADVLSLEADVIKELLGEVSADDFKFDKLDVKVIPKSNYVFIGDTFRADVLVAALSTTQDPILEAGIEIDTVGGITKIAAENIMKENITVGGGIGLFKFVPKTEGTVMWGGVIKIKKPDGSYKSFDFKHEFTAAKPSLVVSPTAMNVMYRGLDNPIEVSVPGVATELLQINISNGSKTGSKGEFTVKPGKGKECVVSVSANLNGKTQNFGKAIFRVKNVPDPKPKFAGLLGGGNVKANQLRAAGVVLAEMQNFEFDLKFKIVSFAIAGTVKGKAVEAKCRGARLSPQAKTIIGAMKPGRKFYIESIKAKGPDGTVRALGSMAFKVIN